jgi:arylamine N-acetyltransferase
MPRRARVVNTAIKATLCPVCSKSFRMESGMRSHQRQTNHYPIPLQTPPASDTPPPEYRLATQALDEAAAATKKRAKKERQWQRRQARYDLIKDMYVNIVYIFSWKSSLYIFPSVLKMIAEQGAKAILGTNVNAASRGALGGRTSRSPPVDPAPRPPPDPAEVYRLLGEL